jgi:phenylalanine-4-hydroxylase
LTSHAARSRRCATLHQYGLATLRFDLERVPCLDDVNAFMAPLTGFRAKAVAGYVPACLSPSVQRVPFQTEWVGNQGVDFHSMQPLLFIIDAFDQLVDEVGRLERWVREGRRLGHVAGGEPAVSQEELERFVAAVVSAP